MELLLEALGGLILLPLTIAAITLVEAVVVGAVNLLALLGWIAARRHPDVPRGRAWRWVRRLQRVSLVIAGLTVLAAWAFGSWQLEWTLRQWARRIEARTAIAIEWRAVAGSLFGTLAFDDLRLRRTDEGHRSTFDVTVRTCRIELDLWSAWSREARVANVDARGLRGAYARVRKADPFRARRPYRIDDLRIEDGLLQVTDHTARHGPARMAVAVDELRTAPWRSEHAVFDVVLRTNARGRVEERPVTATCRAEDGGHVSAWRADGLPVALAAAYVGGPLAWLRGGVADAAVEHRWVDDGRTPVAMQWRVRLRELAAEVPADAGPVEKLLAGKVAAFVARRPELPLQFDLQIAPEKYRGASSLLDDEVLAQIAKALVQAVAHAIGDNVEALEEAARDRLRRWLGK